MENYEVEQLGSSYAALWSTRGISGCLRPCAGCLIAATYTSDCPPSSWLVSFALPPRYNIQLPLQIVAPLSNHALTPVVIRSKAKESQEQSLDRLHSKLRERAFSRARRVDSLLHCCAHYARNTTETIKLPLHERFPATFKATTTGLLCVIPSGQELGLSPKRDVCRQPYRHKERLLCRQTPPGLVEGTKHALEWISRRRTIKRCTV